MSVPSPEAGQVLHWSGSGQYRPDMPGGEWDAVRTALREFGLAAVRLSEAMSALSGQVPDTDSPVPDALPCAGQPDDTGQDIFVRLEDEQDCPCPRRTDKIEHDAHNFGPVGHICPGW